MISEKVIEQGIKVLESSIGGFTQVGAEMISEYLNFLLFCAVLGLLQKLFVSSLLIPVIRIMNGVIEHNRESLKDEEAYLSDRIKGKNFSTDFEYTRSKIRNLKESIFNLRALKSIIIIASIVLMSVLTLDDIKQIGYIILSPKVYLLKEGKKLFDKNHEVTK